MTGARVMRLLLVIAAATAGVALFFLSAWAADRVSVQSGEKKLPPIEDPVEIGSAAPVVTTTSAGVTTSAGETTATGSATTSATGEAPSGEPAPGAIVSVDTGGPAIEGLPGGMWMLPTDLVAEEGEAPPGTPPAPGQPNPPLFAAGDAASTAAQLGQIAQQPPPLITHFVDLCTTGASPCPIGVAATVTPSYTSGPPEGLKVRASPGLTKALTPGLRCDPGFASSQRLPVVVNVNAPVHSVDLRLEIPGVGVLDDITVKQSTPETEWYSQWTGSGKTTGTDLGNGLHYCASLTTEGDPYNVEALAGKVLPSPLVYKLTVRAVALEGPGVAKTTVKYAAVAAGSRPNTIVQPLTGHTAQVVVAQLDPDRFGAPVVWVTAHWRWGAPTAEGVCALEPREGTYVATPEVQSFDPGQLAQPGYPYDRAYTHYRVWNLVLEEATEYALCVKHGAPGGTETEAWRIETPDGFRFALYLNGFTEVGYTSAIWSIGAPGAGCYRWYVEDTTDVLGLPEHKGAGTYVCESHGLPYPPVTDFRVERNRKGTGGAWEDMGHKWLLTPTWCATGPPVMAGVAPAAEGQWKHGQCAPAQWPVEFVYADQNVLCGGDCGDKYVRARLQTVVHIEEGSTNGRRDPLDWVLEGPTGERGISPPGAGPSGPGLGGP